MQSNPEAQNQISVAASQVQSNQSVGNQPGPQPGYNPFSNNDSVAAPPQTEDEDFVFEAFARTRLQQQT